MALPKTPTTPEEIKNEQNALDAEAMEAAEANVKKAEAEAEREREEKLAEANLTRTEGSVMGLGIVAVAGMAGIFRTKEEDKFEREYNRIRKKQLNSFRQEQARINKDVHEREEREFRQNNPGATQEDIDNLHAQQRLRARETEVHYRCSQLDSDAIGRYEARLTAKNDQIGLKKLERFHAYHTTDPYGKDVDPSLARSAKILQRRRFEQMHRELAMGKRELWSIEAERQLRGLPTSERDRLLRTHLGEKYKSKGLDKDAKALGKKGSFQKANEEIDKTGKIHALRQNAYGQFRENNMVAYQRNWKKFGNYYQKPKDDEIKAFHQRFVDRQKIHQQAIQTRRPFAVRPLAGRPPRTNMTLVRGPTRGTNIVNGLNKIGGLGQGFARRFNSAKRGANSLAKKLNPLNKLKPQNIFKTWLRNFFIANAITFAITFFIIIVATIGFQSFISNFGNGQTTQQSQQDLPLQIPGLTGPSIDGPTQVPTAQNLIYTVTVAYIGTQNIILSESIPNNATFVSSSAPRQITNKTIIWILNNLTPTLIDTDGTKHYSFTFTLQPITTDTIVLNSVNATIH